MYTVLTLQELGRHLDLTQGLYRTLDIDILAHLSQRNPGGINPLDPPVIARYARSRFPHQKFLDPPLNIIPKIRKY